MNRRTKETQSNAGINSALQGGGRPKVKSFGQKSWMLPQPVLIIGTYDKNGKPNAMNAAWGGQWDAKEIMIAMGAHATTDNLNNCPDFTVAFATKQTMVAADFVGIVSAKNDADKMAKAGWKCEKAEHVNAPVFTDSSIFSLMRHSKVMGKSVNTGALTCSAFSHFQPAFAILSASFLADTMPTKSAATMVCFVANATVKSGQLFRLSVVACASMAIIISFASH